MDNNVRNVLIISTVGLSYEGITGVIMSYAECMDLDGICLYFASTIKSDERVINRISKIGGKIIALPDRRKNTVDYFLKLLKEIKNKKIDVVHAHGNSATLAIEMTAAFLAGAKKRIAHSHNTRCDQVRADKILRPLFYLMYTDALACGENAGRWLFGKRDFVVLKNGRKIQDYVFDKGIREKTRKELGVEGALVIGHIGGFVEQKNHAFIIEIIKNIIKVRDDIKFVLIGDGPLKSKVETQVKELKDRVKLIGTTDNVTAYLNAMDIMILPSLFEGVPLVAVEAQINGLPLIMSDKISKECIFTESVVIECLDKGVEAWCEKIFGIQLEDRDKQSEYATVLVKKAGFDISDNSHKLREMYVH